MEPRVKFGADGPLLAGGLALALGSGGARGFAHIGVLQVLEEQGIRPLMLAGSSVPPWENDLTKSLKLAR